MGADAERIIRATTQRAAAVVSLGDPDGRRATVELLEYLRAADANLARRLARFAAGDPVTFTAAQASAMRAQIRIVSQFVEARLLGLTEQQAGLAVAKGVKATGQLLQHLELAFNGLNAPLQIRQASAMSRLIHGTKASLLAQHETSVDRYGTAMQMQMERRMRQGLLEGKNTHQMVDDLVKLKGPKGTVSLAGRVTAGGVVRIAEEEIPEGLFVRYRSFAERVVRTEVANAYEEANHCSLFAARRELPDLQKKILAHFDDRTAPDSIAVHGQIRPLEGMFIDGAGRQYLRPPARPNDRETVIPWRPSWEDKGETTPLSAARAGKAIAENIRISAATRAETAQSGAAQRLAIAKNGAASLRGQQAAAQVANRRGEAAKKSS